MESKQLPSNYCLNRGGGGLCGLRSSASLAEIKFIIKTSILPPTSTECPGSTKKIQKLLQNGGDSSFEQSMEFKPINAQPNIIAPWFSKLVDKSTGDDDQRIVIEDDEHGHDDDAGITECVQNHSLVTVVHPKEEDNKRLAVNSIGDITGRRSNSNVQCDDVGKVLKRPKLDEISLRSATIPLIRSSSSTHIAEPKTSFFGMRSFSLTPSPSVFRKNYTRGRLSGSFIREKLVLPTIVITSTPIKESIGVENDNERKENYGRKTSSFEKIPSPLSKENMLIFDASLAVESGTEEGRDVEENMEFSFICEPSQSECGDESMENSMTASCELQPPLEPQYSTISKKNDEDVLNRCLSVHRRDEVSAGDGCDGADVTAFEAKKDPVIGIVGKEARDQTRRHNKENEFLVPDKSKCLNSKRVKSATVRVLHAFTVSGGVLGGVPKIYCWEGYQLGRTVGIPRNAINDLQQDGEHVGRIHTNNS